VLFAALEHLRKHRVLPDPHSADTKHFLCEFLLSVVSFILDMPETERRRMDAFGSLLRDIAGLIPVFIDSDHDEFIISAKQIVQSQRARFYTATERVESYYSYYSVPRTSMSDYLKANSGGGISD
jgi:hypothetical protein